MQNVASGRLITSTCRLARVPTIIALAVVSLLPADTISIHRSGLGGQGEHLIAYAGTVLVFCIGSHQRAWPQLLVALVSYAALLETLQLFVPGRVSRVSDFLYSALGILVGFVVIRAVQAVSVGRGRGWRQRKDASDGL